MTAVDWEQVARYLVSGGCEIIIEPHPTATEKDVRLFLLGSAMGALLLQRGIWPLHGSAIAGRSGAALFVGVSGSGKSTLVGAFHQRGFQVLADDVCAITAGSPPLISVLNIASGSWVDVNALVQYLLQSHSMHSYAWRLSLMLVAASPS